METASVVGSQVSEVDVERAHAHARAYELIEAVQAAPGSHDLTAPLQQADARGWWDVCFLLHYAVFAQAYRSGQDFADELLQMFALADLDDNPVLLAIALATRAEHEAGAGDVARSESVESDLARAVALLGEDRGSDADRPTAYVACGLAYHVRGLWELEEEMYQEAGRLLQVALPSPLDRTKEPVRRLLPYNRREALLAWAFALLELGERGAAAAVARRGLSLPVDVPALPPEWVDEIAAIDYAFAAIAAEPRPVPVEAMAARIRPLAWAGSRG
ncbi:MAG: hypothetical protein WAL50_05580, partial [Kineosporiaceae bacterium]